MSAGERAAVAFHDAECGGYAADLALWDELAAAHGSPLLELGAGAGRVTLRLAARGHRVVAVERDPVLADALRARALEARLAVVVSSSDVRDLDLEQSFALVLAPMQLLQLLDGAGGRRRALERIAAHLTPAGLLAAAIVEGAPPEAVAEGRPPLPDIRERAGWTYSSLPLGAELRGGSLRVSRLRQAVSPGGALRERVDLTHLDLLDASKLESEMGAVGLLPAGRRTVAATDAHVGSTVVLARAPR